MKRFAGWLGLISLFLLTLIGCSAEKTPGPLTETESFVFVSEATNNEGPDDVLMLNNWLRLNPNKKVISFSGVLFYREGVSGYILYFEEGDNSQQSFVKIYRDDTRVKPGHTRLEPGPSIHGIHFLQDWIDTHPDSRMMAITTIPDYSGGVREFMILYEE